MIRRVLLFLALLIPLELQAEESAAFDATDAHALQLALRALMMTECDLGFQKTNVEAELVLPQARLFLQEPLQLPNDATHLMNMKFSKERNLCSLAIIAFGETQYGGVGKFLSFMKDDTDPAFLAKLPLPVGQAIEQIIESSHLATRELGRTLPTNSVAALASFAEEELHIATDKTEIESWKQIGIDTGPLTNLLEREARLELQDTVLVDAILSASDQFSSSEAFISHQYSSSGLSLASRTLARTVDNAVTLLQTNRFTGDFQYETNTEFGKIIVTGTGNHTFTNEAFLIIALGGTNTYLNSAGGANGLVGRPYSIVIDLGNNTQFISRRSFSQGSGVFGIGILAALGSNCTFQAKHLSQGAGFFGCGILMTGPGKQTLEADTFCQGAALFGTGILWQRGENSSCRAAYMAQGFAGPQGVGLLLNERSHNSYFAGGKYPCPWLPGHFFSLSQGFGYGMRPYAGGGIGILCDLAGQNHYEADVYGQGASYWYSVGLVLDAAGHNRYDAHQYCQGAGIHLSTGALIDWGGNNIYTANHICQGAAHDYSVGMLIDRVGNNQFTGDTTAQGAAINNSFALLLEHAGTNTYVGTDPKQSQATGHNGDKREYGSIGLLLDLGGHGHYSQGQTNNAIWLKPLYGAGLDCEISKVVRRSPDRALGLTAGLPSNTAWSGDHCQTASTRLYQIAPVDPHQPIEHLFRIATSDRPDAAKAWDELKHLGTSALEYLLPRLASPNVMVRVKVEELVDHLSTNSILPLIAGIRAATDDDVARLCCYFLARFGDQISGTGVTPVNSSADKRAGRPFHYAEAVQAILPLLTRDKCRATAFYTLGHLRAAEAFRPAMAALDEPRELVRLRATQALGKIGDRQAIPALLRMLDDGMYDVRYAAEDALINFGQPSRAPLRDAYRRATPRAQAHILEALAKLGDETALTWAREYYRSDDPLVRDAVLKSLTAALTPAPKEK